jgi:hypothetical protein
LKTGGAVPNWNIYSPKWAPVEVAEFPSETNKSILLKDKDPYDYARAIRVFEELQKATIEVNVLPKQNDNGIFEVDIADRYGNRPVQIRFDNDGKIKAVDGSMETDLQEYNAEDWYNVKIVVDAKPYGTYSLWINGEQVLKDAQLAEAVKSVERISFRTGPYRNIPNRKTPNETPVPPLEGADEPVKMVQYYIDDLKVK